MPDDTANAPSPTEYERALLSAIMALTQAVVMGEKGRSELKRLYQHAAVEEQTKGRRNGQALLQYLARLAEEDRYGSERPTFQPFEVIEGGKPDGDI